MSDYAPSSSSAPSSSGSISSTSSSDFLNQVISRHFNQRGHTLETVKQLPKEEQMSLMADILKSSVKAADPDRLDDSVFERVGMSRERFQQISEVMGHALNTSTARGSAALESAFPPPEYRTEVDNIRHDSSKDFVQGVRKLAVKGSRACDMDLSLRKCSLCNMQEKDLPPTEAGEVATLMKCGACKVVYYCSKTCQTSDWKQHKKSCAGYKK